MESPFRKALTNTIEKVFFALGLPPCHSLVTALRWVNVRILSDLSKTWDPMEVPQTYYRLDKVNSKSFISKFLLQIKWNSN